MNYFFLRTITQIGNSLTSGRSYDLLEPQHSSSEYRRQNEYIMYNNNLIIFVLLTRAPYFRLNLRFEELFINENT